MDKELVKDVAFNDSPDIYSKQIEAIPKPKPQIGIDLENSLYQNIIASEGINSYFDLQKLDSFSQV